MAGFDAIGAIGSREHEKTDKVAFWQKDLNTNLEGSATHIAKLDIGNYLNGSKTYA